MNGGRTSKRDKDGRLMTPAQRLDGFLDRACQGSRSTHRTMSKQEYNPISTWDALSDCSTNDHTLALKFQSKEVVTQHTRPICLIGSRVIPMEKDTDGLAGICVNQDARTLTTIPLSVEQETIGMKSNLDRISVPLCENAVKENKTVVETTPATFQRMQMMPPEFEPVQEPSFYKDCGPQLDKLLLTPAQRREIFEYEKKKAAADLYVRQAVSDRSKLRKNLKGIDYKRGVVGYDNGINPESEIYGENAKAYVEMKDSKQMFDEARRNYLGAKRSNLQHSGNILNPDLMSNDVKTEKYYQNKGGDRHAPTFGETYYRVLESNKEIKRDSAKRTQYLRDQDLNGKNYNIVNHTEIKLWPSKTQERVYERMNHPSQTSLDGPRNLQGSLKPF